MSTSVHGPMLLVVNPRAGASRGTALEVARTTLRALDVDHDVVHTTRSGDATAVTRRAVRDEGVRFVVAVGGDGTVHEVVNGMVDAASGRPHADDLVLGVVPAGSGCDFVRTWGLDLATARLVERHLVTAATLPLDLGRVRCLDVDGDAHVRVFANIANCGWVADVARRADRLPRIVGRARYLTATIASALRLTATETSVTTAQGTTTEAMTEVVVANGQFFGGGIKIAPRALPDDGRFNVQTWRGGTRELLEQLPRARVGEHLSSPTVREWQSPTVEVRSASPLPVEADGEVFGTTPARFDVLHRVLRLSA